MFPVPPTAPGGAPANVAVAAARLGSRTAFVGAVGDDPFGHALAALLHDEGVDVSVAAAGPANRELEEITRGRVVAFLSSPRPS